jgi:hypothetical protein
MHLNIRRLGSPEPSPKVTCKNKKIYISEFHIYYSKNFFMVCQNPCNNFSWWHKNIFTTIFLLLYLLLPLRLGPTYHRDTRQIFTYLILSLHPPAPSFPTHKAFILVLEDSRKWMEERAPECRLGGTDRPHQQADRPPPLALFK